MKAIKYEALILVEPRRIFISPEEGEKLLVKTLCIWSRVFTDVFWLAPLLQYVKM